MVITNPISKIYWVINYIIAMKKQDIWLEVIKLSIRKEIMKPTTALLIRKKTSKEKKKPATGPNSYSFQNRVATPS